MMSAGIPATPTVFAELASDLLRAGNALRFRAHGGSMQPLIRDGDVLLVRPVDSGTVQVGDVVLFHGGPGHVLVHRVIRVQVTRQGRWFTVQGDALSQPDGDIPESHVFGCVVGIERGSVHLGLQRPLMRALARAAVLRSRWGLGRGSQLRWVKGLVKRLPGLDRYLA